MNSKRLMRENITKLAIPKGELLPGLLQFFESKNCVARPIENSTLVYEFPHLALPLMLVAMRPRDIWKMVDNPGTDTWFGITGSDIVQEQSLDVYQDLPAEAVAKSGRLAFGFTPNLMEAVAKPQLKTLDALTGSYVVTPYPKTAEKFLRERQIWTRVIEVLGATEALWWADANCMAVLDVIISGNTFAQNNIVEADTVLSEIKAHVITESGRETNQYREKQFDRDKEIMDDFLQRLKSEERKK